MNWDLFISYASEDRDDIVEPLVQALRSYGLRVWYDQSELKLGDSLRRRIDEGLSQSLYGIVVLSPSFFGKHWPQLELDGMAHREVGGRKVILPVWFGVSYDDVKSYSPTLVDHFAAQWKQGLSKVVQMIIQVVRPDLRASLPQGAELVSNVYNRLKKAEEIISQYEKPLFVEGTNEMNDSFERLARVIGRNLESKSDIPIMQKVLQSRFESLKDTLPKEFLTFLGHNNLIDRNQNLTIKGTRVLIEITRRIGV